MAVPAARMSGRAEVSFDFQLWQLIALLLGTAGFGGVVSRLIAKWMDFRLAKRGQTDNVALSLVDQLSARLNTVEADLRRERVVCDAKLSHERRRNNNLALSFDGMLMVLEVAPEKSAEAIRKVKELRALHLQSEATELAAINAVLVSSGLADAQIEAPADPVA